MNVTRLAVTCTALAKAESAVRKLRTQRDNQIVALLDDGYTTDDVAAYAGMSQPRVTQIAKKARAAQPQPASGTEGG